MDWVVAMRLLVFAVVVLLLPQGVGLAGYRFTRKNAFQSKIATILIPPLLFFVTADMYWAHVAQSTRAAGGYVCGAMGMLATFSTMLGTLFHLIAGACVFAVLNLWRKRHATTMPV